ncbi:MAG: ferredoxin [DPANN group archaeon]|nr:ferredoxin [DPANN group archaeon]
MAKYKVTLNREECIGAGVCVAEAPEKWKMNNDGKVDALDGTKNGDNSLHEFEISEEQLDKVLRSAQVCPVTVIHIKNLDTGEELI